MKMKTVLIAALLGISAGVFISAPDHVDAPKIAKSQAMPSIDVLAFSAAHAEGAVAPSGVPVMAASVVVQPPVDPTKDVETKAFLDLLWASIKGWKGLGALGVAAGLTQLLAMFMMTPLFQSVIKLKKPIEDWMGKWKLALVCGLSMASGILMLIATGLDWKAALVHSSTLTAFQVLFHQIFKQGAEKKAA